MVRKWYKMGHGEILRGYALEHERPFIIVKAHYGVEGGQYSGKKIS